MRRSNFSKEMYACVCVCVCVFVCWGRVDTGVAKIEERRNRC